MRENDANPVEWRLHLASPPDRVYRALTSADGRESFWAESAADVDGAIQFAFPNGFELESQILEARPGEKFAVEYFDGIASFELEPDGDGGTDLTLRHEGLPPEERCETAAGWVSVLLALKAAVDHSIDLRNHDPDRTWSEGYVDN